MDHYELTGDMIEGLESIINLWGEDNYIIDAILLELKLKMVDGHLTDEW